MQHFIVTFGYLAVFILMLAESACIPIPSEVTMLFAGALAAGAIPDGRLNIVLVILAGTLGNVAGSYLAWAIGRYAGQAALHRWGRRLWLRDEDIAKAHRWFTRHGPASVFFGRLLPAIRTFISLPAGFADMAPVRFGLYTFAGCLPWTAVLALVGYAIGANWQKVADGFKGPTYIIAAIVVLACAAAVTVFIRRRRTSKVES
ncbi:DedA family protein [Rugosimonospora africana]|uniref:Alkaline phosphatase n=1 Tax=Rugosimonospora africana TaxID=556532 RepID=A0A8J3R2V7_9ACTN|nr:DedA family protein [Rugosimonospora africana]GIH21423.1 alkaline phosphatase [Rugosimonospora africana]